MRGKLFLIYGVHGSGKTFLLRPLAEDYGLIYISTDVIDEVANKISSEFERELLFIQRSNESLVESLKLLESGKDVVMDFSPLQNIAYVKYWIKDKRKEGLIKLIESSFSSTISRIRDCGRIIHVFFVVRDYGKIIERIRRRGRNVEEEAREDYIRFINEELSKLAEELRQKGEEVYFIEAELPIFERMKEFLRILDRTSR